MKKNKGTITSNIRPLTPEEFKKEKIRIRKARYYLLNREKIIKQTKEWKKNNKERAKQHDKKAREKRKEYQKEYQKTYQKEYRRKKKEEKQLLLKQANQQQEK